MRRKLYSELLAEASAGMKPAAKPAPKPAPAPARAPISISSLAPKAVQASAASATLPAASGMSQAAMARCKAEIRAIAAMIEHYRRGADAEGKKMCLFAEEKLGQAASSLAAGDGDGAWVQIFGAAMMCRTFQIQPEEATRVIARLNSMLN